MTEAKDISQVMEDKIAVGDGCWEWLGSKTSNGYGQVAIKREIFKAHRVVYEWLVGTIPRGLEIDHLCRNRSCVRPDHLEPVTRVVNIRRARAAATA